MTIAEKIDALRIERGWSINYLAMESMLTQSTINNMFNRKTEPTISTLRSICGAFGITLSEFFAEEETPSDLNSELNRRINSLSTEQKEALLTILKSIK